MSVAVRFRKNFVLTIAASVLTGFALMACAGCLDRTEHSSTRAGSSSEASSQSGRVLLSWDRASLTTAERLSVDIEIVAAKGKRATLPAFDQQLGKWRVWSMRVEEDLIDPDGKSHGRAHLVLEPFLDGDYDIPPITVSFRDRVVGTTSGKSGANEQSRPAREFLSTERVKIPVRSVLTDAQATDQVPAPREYVRTPSTDHTARWWLGGGVTLAGFVVAAVAVYRLKRRPQPTINGASVDRLILERAVARNDMTSITPDRIARVLSAFAPSAGTPPIEVSDADAQDIQSRLDLWRFGGVEPASEELASTAGHVLQQTRGCVGAPAHGEQA